MKIIIIMIRNFTLNLSYNIKLTISNIRNIQRIYCHGTRTSIQQVLQSHQTGYTMHNLNVKVCKQAHRGELKSQESSPLPSSRHNGTETGSLDGRISGRRRALPRVQQLTVIIIAFYFIAIHLFIYQSGKCSFEPYNNRLCSCKRTAFIPILENTLLYSRFPEFFLPSKGMSLLRIVLVDRFVA